MDLFSYRTGIKKNPDSYQIKSISDELRNRLWTCLYNHFFSQPFRWDVLGDLENAEHRRLCELR
jgi:hypothetical protein